MKKIISIVCSIVLLITSLSMALPTFASTGNSIDTVVEGLSELYQEEAESGKELEESAQCRIIVKANRKPDIYGNAQLVKGTDKIYIYQYSNVTSANAALEYYNSLSYVQWAETDGIMEGQSLSYGNDMMGSDEAKSYIVNNNVSLSEVKIALIDTGVYLSGNTYKEYSHRIIDSGYNFSDSGNENTASADNPHGPKIASILLDNTSDNVKVIAYKAANKNNKGTNSALALAVDQAVKDKVNIISLSLSGTTPSSLLEESIKNAVNNNIVVVCAAGNSSDDVSKYYPANMDEVFTVGAIDKNGNRAFFSNFGEEIDFVAPGHYIETKATNNTTKEMGTSFSVPFVDAVAAMVLSIHPDFTPNEVKQRLIDSCVSMNNLAYHDGFHAIEEYDINDTSGQAPKTYFAISDPETEEECYGYGMPQMLKAMNITEQNNSVVFSVESGTYHNEFELILSADDNADIYYTTDESYPSANNGTLYTVPILIDETTSVRAIAITKDKSKSASTACEYKMEYFANEKDFIINDDGLITEYKGKLNEFIVPDEINGITVKGIASYTFDNNKQIIGIVLPDTAIKLEEFAFVGCNSLKFFSGVGITHIDDYALCCDELVICDIPNVIYIGESGLGGKLRKIDFFHLKYAGALAFYDMPCLSYVNLPLLESIEYSTFAYCEVLRTININAVKYIDYAAFSHCYRLKNIYVPSLTETKFTSDMGSDDGVFYLCYNLTDITEDNFPNIQNVAECSFSNCINLESVSLPSVEYIGAGAFYYTSVNKVNLPKVEYIESNAFGFTPKLKEINLPSVLSIENIAFRNSSVETVYAPLLKNIGSYCFSGYNEMYRTYNISNYLKTLYTPDLESMDDYAFAYTGGLTKLDLPNLKAIGNNAFYESAVNYLYAPNLEKADSLPTVDDSVVVTSKTLTECTVTQPNKLLYIQGNKGSYMEEFANEHNLEFIDVDAMGGSIRVSDAGLRFGFSFYDTMNKSVDEYGFIYTSDAADREKLNIDNVDGKEVYKLKANNRITHEDGITTYNLVLTDIPKASYNQNVSARAYVKINGRYLYSDILIRSFIQVANLVLNDDEVDSVTKNRVSQLLNA